MQETPISLTLWKDNRVVNFLFTFMGSSLMSTIKRFNQKSKTKLDISLPSCHEIIQFHVSGTDLLDAYIARYKIQMKTQK